MSKYVVWCMAALLLSAAGSVAAQKNTRDKVYRWVDENGEVHYSATLPPDFQDRKADVLDDQGILREKDISLVPPAPQQSVAPKGELPRDKSGMQRPEPMYGEQELKAKQDALMLLRYDSDQEILDAMEVEIDQLAYDERLLIASRESLDEAYRGNVREAAERQRAGLAVEPELARDIQRIKRRMMENERSIAGLRSREEAIRSTFEASLERYRSLVAEQAAEQATEQAAAPDQEAAE